MANVELSPEVLDDLKALETHHGELRKEIERAKTAGLDMSEYEAKLVELERVRTGLVKVYGSPRRTRNTA